MSDNLSKKIDPRFDSGNVALLGWCVHFNISEFVLDFESVQKVLEAAGIDKDLISPTKERGAAIRAAKALSKSKAKRGDTFHRRTAETDEKAAFAVVSTSADANLDAEFHQDTKIVYDKKNRSIEAEGADADKVKELFEEFKGKYTGTQWRLACLSFLKNTCKAVSVRSSGGVYFVPNHLRNELEKLVAVSDSLGAGSFDINLIPIVDISSAKTSIAKSGLDDLKEDLADFVKELESREAINERGLRTRLEKFKALKDKVETYELLLQIKAEELHTGIEELTKKLHEKLQD